MFRDSDPVSSTYFPLLFPPPGSLPSHLSPPSASFPQFGPRHSPPLLYRSRAEHCKFRAEATGPILLPSRPRRTINAFKRQDPRKFSESNMDNDRPYVRHLTEPSGKLFFPLDVVFERDSNPHLSRLPFAFCAGFESSARLLTLRLIGGSDRKRLTKSALHSP